MLHWAGGAQDCEHLADAGGFGELQFAGMQGAVACGGEGQDAKDQRTSDDALLGQIDRDLLQAAPRHDDGSRGWQRAGCVVLAIQPAGGATDDEEQDDGGER